MDVCKESFEPAESNHLQLSWLEILKGPDEMKFSSLDSSI